jgi:hypothetical protein
MLAAIGPGSLSFSTCALFRGQIKLPAKNAKYSKSANFQKKNQILSLGRPFQE